VENDFIHITEYIIDYFCKNKKKRLSIFCVIYDQVMMKRRFKQDHYNEVSRQKGTLK